MTTECQGCLGDPDTVCDACGQHTCWEGEYMCQEAQIAHHRAHANKQGYCGAIVWSPAGEIEGPCAREVGHEGEHAP